VADATFTATNVVYISGGQLGTGIAQAAVAQGQPCYRDPATGNYAPAKADTLVHSGNSGIVIALSAAGASQQFVFIQPGGGGVVLTYGSGVFTQGTVYYVSAATAGGIAIYADLGSGTYITPLGMALSASQLYFAPIITPSGTTHP
jgi:hypothetical protein